MTELMPLLPADGDLDYSCQARSKVERLEREVQLVVIVSFWRPMSRAVGNSCQALLMQPASHQPARASQPLH
jgi:hypothetical protein